MADKFRLFIVCTSCDGTGLLPWGDGPGQGGNVTCPTCEDDPGNDLGPVVFDDVRHIYIGRFEEVEDE